VCTRVKNTVLVLFHLFTVLCHNQRMSANLRARVRAELTEEIKATARRRLAVDGANLAIRAVARDMDLVPSALYRYFASRDELLTALIMDAYQALGAAAEQAAAAVPTGRYRKRWLAIGHAVRDWALANAPEYALLYGSPVPGYAAPAGTIAPASRVILALAAVLSDAAAAGVLGQRRLPSALRPDLDRLIRDAGERPAPATRAVLTGALTAWVHLFGLVSFEVFNRLDDMIAARAEYFDHQMNLMADLAGLP